MLEYALLNHRRRSSIPLWPRFGVPLSHSRLWTSLPVRWCSTCMAAPLDGCSSTPVSPPWPGFAPLNYIPRSSINISTPLAHPALHIRHSSFAGGAPLFPPNSSSCVSNSILILCDLASQFQPFKYHKWSQMTLECNFTHSPGWNYSEMQGAPSASLRCWWIVCFCVFWLRWDWRFSRWHWDYVGLISFRSLSQVIVSVLPAFIFQSLTIFFGSP